MTPATLEELQEIPRSVIAESSAPLPIIQFPDGHTEPAPAGSVHAEDIIGQLTSEQIEELAAAKISGKLTSEQIESIKAAQIVGIIVNEQIGNLEAKKITGELENAQIKSIAANKITGELTNVQIKEVAAAKITGEIVSTQIGPEAITTPKLAAGAVIAEKIAANSIVTSKLAAGSITTEKIATGAIIAEKIAAGAIVSEKIAAGAIIAEKIGAEAVETSKLAALSVTAAKIAALTITAEQIAAGAIVTSKLGAESVVAEKISAGAITTTKIAANAVTAEKITVKELSALSANLGNITAGTLKAVVLEAVTGSFEGHVSAKAIDLPDSATIEGETNSKVSWLISGSQETTLFGAHDAAFGYLLINANAGKKRPGGFVQLAAIAETTTRKASLIVTSHKTEEVKVAVRMEGEGFLEKMILDFKGNSDFLQLQTGGVKREVSFGLVELEWPGGSIESKLKEIAHGLKKSPKTILLTIESGPGDWAVAEAKGTETLLKIKGRTLASTPAAGTKGKFWWLAIG